MAFGVSGNQKQPLGGSKICVICLVLYLLVHCLYFRRRIPGDLWDQREIRDPSQSADYSVKKSNELRPVECLYGCEEPVLQRWEKTSLCDFWGRHLKIEKEKWDCWVSHSRVLGVNNKSMGSDWSCVFLTFWTQISMSRRSRWVYGICNCFIFPGLKILCKLWYYFPFLTAEPWFGGNECFIPLWKYINRWKRQGRVERQGGDSLVLDKNPVFFLKTEWALGPAGYFKLKLEFLFSFIHLCKRTKCWEMWGRKYLRRLSEKRQNYGHRAAISVRSNHSAK